MIRRRYEALQTRIDALSLRERAIIFVALSAFIYLLWNTMLMIPMGNEQKSLQSQIKTMRTEISAMDGQVANIMQQHNVDPNKHEREQLVQLDRQLEQANKRISKMITGLIPPEEMAKILEQVLHKQQGLSFVKLENLGSKALVDVQTEGATPEATGIFKHSFRIELEGSFNQTLAYLRALETLPWQFRWDEVKLTTQNYPKAHVVITVHTLSLQEGWIGV